MKRSVIAFTIVATLFGLGCVMRTEHKIEAHITLDIRHIGEQAEDVLNFIEGKTDELPGFVEGSDDSSWLQRTSEFLNPMPVAYAAEMKTSSALAQEIAVRMRDRHSKIEALKKLKCLGENNRAYLELREVDYLKDDKKRNEVQKIMTDENKDRKALYKELTRINEENGATVTDIEKIYAKKRLSRATSGEIFQLPSAGKDFDDFKASAMGKKLGDKCKADDWVTIP